MIKTANDLDLDEVSVIGILAAFLEVCAEENPQVETDFASYLADVAANIKASRLSRVANAAAFEQAIAEVEAEGVKAGRQPYKTICLEDVLPPECLKALTLFTSRINAGFVKTNAQFKEELRAIVAPHEKYAEERGLVLEYLLHAIEYAFTVGGVKIP